MADYPPFWINGYTIDGDTFIELICPACEWHDLQGELVILSHILLNAVEHEMRCPGVNEK